MPDESGALQRRLQKLRSACEFRLGTQYVSWQNRNSIGLRNLSRRSTERRPERRTGKRSLYRVRQFRSIRPRHASVAAIPTSQPRPQQFAHHTSATTSRLAAARTPRPLCRNLGSDGRSRITFKLLGFSTRSRIAWSSSVLPRRSKLLLHTAARNRRKRQYHLHSRA